jgi:calcineurin-like phosphoesterase family protein
MIEPVNVLHLSDLHFGLEGDPKIAPTAIAQRQNALKPLIKLLAGLESDWRPAIVAVSGDIGWRGAATDYKAAAIFLTELVDTLGLPRERLILCVGNHDIDRTATSGMLPPPSDREADDWLRVERLDNLARPFAAYTEFCVELGLPPLRIGNASHRLVGQRDVLGLRFVVLNSAWFCRGDSDKGKLWIGLPQLELMQSHDQLVDPDQADNGSITIGLLHHPREDLNDAENNSYGNRPATYRYLAERSHLLLFGHVHGAIEMATRYHQAAYGISGGASYADGTYRNNFSILRIAPGSRDVWRRSFEFEPRFREWCEFDKKALSLLRAQSVAHRVVIPAVHFQTERIPDEIDLQRAIHAVYVAVKDRPIGDELAIPLVYDPRIAMLIAGLERHYERFREDMRGAGMAPDANALDALRAAIDNASDRMETLPKRLALFTETIAQNTIIRRRDVFARRACTRFVELAMTRVLVSLASYQLVSNGQVIFRDYAGLRSSTDEYVAKIENVPVNDVVTYLVTRADRSCDDLVFAPLKFSGLVCEAGGSPYLPSITFLTDYLGILRLTYHAT